MQFFYHIVLDKNIFRSIIYEKYEPFEYNILAENPNFCLFRLFTFCPHQKIKTNSSKPTKPRCRAQMKNWIYLPSRFKNNFILLNIRYNWNKWGLDVIRYTFAMNLINNIGVFYQHQRRVWGAMKKLKHRIN